MKVTLYASKASVPDKLGDHIIVYTGVDHSQHEFDPSIVTEIHCAYTVSGQLIEFRKKTPTQNFTRLWPF